MGRYKRENMTSGLDRDFLGFHTSKIRDRTTGEEASAVGKTQKEADSNAWKTLKRADKSDPNYSSGPSNDESDSKANSWGGGGSAGGGSSGGGGGSGSDGMGCGSAVLALILMGVIGGLLYSNGSDHPNKKPQQEISISKKYDNGRNLTSRVDLTKQTQEQSLEERINTSLEQWLKKWNELGTIRPLEDYEIIGNNIWVVAEFDRSPFLCLFEGYILYSSNAGKTWEIQWKNHHSCPYFRIPFEVEFLNEEEGWVATNVDILHTINGGKTWNVISKPDLPLAVYIEKFKVIDYNHLRISLDDGNLYDSFDGGLTWGLCKRN